MIESNLTLNRVKAVLCEKNKTSKWLAGKLGKNAATVSKWCQNRTQPDLQTLNQIATLLDIDIKELIVSNR